MSEPKSLVQKVSYENGYGVESGTVNVRRNRTEAETRAQIDRLIYNYG